MDNATKCIFCEKYESGRYGIVQLQKLYSGAIAPVCSKHKEKARRKPKSMQEILAKTIPPDGR